MASSKSSRAKRTRSIYSIPLPSFLQDDCGALQDKENENEKTGHFRQDFELDQRSEPASNLASAAVVEEHHEPTHAVSEPVLLGKTRTRKSKLSLLSSFLPSLNSEPADIPPSNSIHRKPVASTYPPPAQQSNPPPPPYSHEESKLVIDEPPVGLGVFQPGFPGAQNQHQQYSQTQPSQPDAQHSRLPKMPHLIHKAQKPATVPQPAHAPPPVPPSKGRSMQPLPEFKETQASPPLLKKTREKKRSNSLHRPDVVSKDHRSARLHPRREPSPSPEPRGRSSSAQPPAGKRGQLDAARTASNPTGSRPQSTHSSDGTQSPNRGSDRGRLRRSWLPGGRSRANSHDMSSQQQQAGNSVAWVMSPDSHADYNVAFLTNREKVPELWNENGTVYVYLNTKGSGHGASFKVPSYIVSHSRVFNDLIEADMSSPVSARSRARSFGGRGSLCVDDATRRTLSPPSSPPLSGIEGLGESRLYLSMAPVANGQLDAPNHQPRQDLERLIALRNLFAFLTGQPLVGTRAHGTIFSAFLQIGSLLREFDFNNVDGSSFGEAVDLSFGFYMDQFALADLRHSREKTIEALILGERMRSWELYNEAFAHAVGKYAAILEIKSALFEQVSLNTRQRLERAHLDLLSRQHNVNIRLEQFEFPGLFAGIASSTSNTDFRNIRFKNWRTSFGDMRTFILKYYKGLFGNWPPKASSKKNPFSESGLNRQVLKVLYSDLCSLYDLIVDRESITPRVIDQAPEDLSESVDPMIFALRKMLGEFDHSSPPVLPPVPFDVPKIPTMATIKETYTDMAAKAQTRFDKNIQSNELQLIMVKSHNFDTDSLKLPFLDSFREFELKEARGKTSIELAEQRIGYWVFLYVVIQCLPMLVVDAPNLHFTEGVEYFLCEPPQGNLPWVEDAGEVRKMWYQTAGGAQIVELSADVVMFSVEATYHRSHCWLAAKQWEGVDGAVAHHPPAMSPLVPPRSVFENMDPVGSPPPLSGPSPPPGSPAQLPVRGRSPHRVSGYRPSSIAMGLEPLRFEDGSPGRGDRNSRIVSAPVARSHDTRRSASHGNLRAMMNTNSGPHRESPPMPKERQGSQGGGSTFDTILQGMDNQKKDKKKSSFLPFKG